MVTTFEDLLKDPLKEETNIPETKKDISNPDENEIGNIESVLNGIASGVLKIPEGVVSLGAELYDLG